MMKVRCIDNKGEKRDLSINKIYECMKNREGYDISNNLFWVKGNLNIWKPYFKTRFEIVEEEKEVDETVSTWEMIKALMENPKRKATNICHDYTVKVNDSGLITLDDGSLLYLYVFYQNREIKPEWTIIEPPKQLKKMSFAEAFKLHQMDYCDSCWVAKPMISVFSGQSYNSPYGISATEINGEWNVEGVYEDD